MNLLKEKALQHLTFFCEEISNRCVGSAGNLAATQYFKEQLEAMNWQVETQEFKAFDWDSLGAEVVFGEERIAAFSSPYSIAVEAEGTLVQASSMEELNAMDAKDKILLITGDLASEPLMPKNFVFYNPEHHQKTVSLLEDSVAKALIFIVSRSGFNEGGEYPYPIIEDGDFELPSVYLSEEDGKKLLEQAPSVVKLISKTVKNPSNGYNVIGRRGPEQAKKIILTAHIDAKKGSPGAIDNATGATTLLLIAERLQSANLPVQTELIALNGEDYYSVPGQMTYLQSKKGDFNDLLLNINIDGVGLNKGKTSVSLFNLPDEYAVQVKKMIEQAPGLVEGAPWYQGDHSMFLQNGVPALAISSEWLLSNLQSQNITHTDRDKLDIVEVEKLVELAEVVGALLLEWGRNW